MQYYTPGIMQGIQNASEPILGGAFRWSADRYARKWGREHGYADDSAEVKARADELCQHEVTHLPHAFVWTGSAAGLNILTQKFITKNPGKTSHLIYGKALGSIGTLALVLGLRTLAPAKIQQLDEWNTKNLAEPITRRVSRWLGIDDATVDRVLDKEREFADGHHIQEQAETQNPATTDHGSDKSSRESQLQTSAPNTHVHSQNASVSRPISLLRLIG